MAPKSEARPAKSASDDAPKRAMKASAFVLPTAATLAHAYFLYSQYDSVVANFNEFGYIDIDLYKTLGLMACYVVFVVVGSWYMKKQPAGYDPQEWMLVYNIYETVLSGFMGAAFAWESFGKGKYSWHSPVDRQNGAFLAYIVWVNYQSKFLEYFDTIFMILRKKFSQVTVLHVSHHAEMGWIMWILCRHAAGGITYFPPMLNSFIHTMMYSYYALTALGFRPSWKKAMTSAQLVQFVLVLAHSVYALLPGQYDKYWPAWVSCVSTALMFQMLYMFGQFFMEQYANKGKGKAAAKDE